MHSDTTFPTIEIADENDIEMRPAYQNRAWHAVAALNPGECAIFRDLDKQQVIDAMKYARNKTRNNYKVRETLDERWAVVRV